MLAPVLSLLAAAAVLSPASPVPASDRGWAARSAAAPVIRVPLPPSGRRLSLPAIAGPAGVDHPLVVIDPGHGGADAGAGRAGEHEEKTVALALARALRDELVAGHRVRVALTRDADRLLTLEERAGIAGQLQADLFVSIHLSRGGPQDTGGLRVYTRADQASDQRAGSLAATENGADRVRNAVLGNPPVAAVWTGSALSPRQVSDRSAVFANLVVRESRGRLRLQANARRQAPLSLLAAVRAPAVLIDAGSLDSADEAAALVSPAGRGRFARVLAQAIETYFARLPPER
jgi:N-acetylmuramoyl-L-alanine amidase